MMNITDAKLIQSFINKRLFDGDEFFTLGDAVRMQPIQTTTCGNGHTILATQYGDLTIMVWVQVTQRGLCVREAKSLAW